VAVEVGKDIALSFAKLHANVVIVGRNKGALDQTLTELQAFHPYNKAVQVDVNDIKNVREMIDEVVRQYGTVDVLVNNAGINIPNPALEVTEEDWDRVLDTNLKATFFFSQAVANHMIGQKRPGRIINIASQMSFVGYIKRAAYCSSKGGVV
jgi:NAD(P)-dependent dehydrogenase (short-subunit alcohol dehydrogenase family)